MKTRVFLFSFFLLAGTSVFAGKMDPYIGKWQVDYKATLAGAKKSPKYDPQKDAKILPNILKKISESLFLEITGDAVIFTRGSETTIMPYSLKSAGKHFVILSCTVKDNAFTLTFETLKKQRLGFKSSLTDDMDFYVWKPGRDTESKK